MTPGSTWIERGSDGRPYFVRKKSKLPSTRELLSNAFAPLRKASSPFPRSYQRDHYMQPASLNNPLYLPAPLPAPSTFPPYQPTQINVHQPQPAATMYHNLQSDQQQNGKNENNPRGILKPTPPAYAVPFPAMVAFQPSQQATGQFPPHVNPHLGPPYSPQPFPGQGLPFPTQPPGISRPPPLPLGARIISPPRLPTADDLKYKCSICGQFRSARYHYKHPIPPGQLPGKTICRKCREEATDSEERTSSESADERKHRRRHSSGHRRAASLEVVPRRASSRRASSRRARSRSRVVYSDEEDDYEYEPSLRGRSYSRSSSLEVEPLRRGSRRARLRRRRSPSVDVVRVERPRRTRRITYIDELPRRTYDYHDHPDRDGYVEEHM
jgi:hypothetical protein